LTERVPGGDESRAQGVVLSHERFQLRAGLANVHDERGFVMHDVMGFGEGLGQFTWNDLAHDAILSTKFLQHRGHPAAWTKVWKSIHFRNLYDNPYMYTPPDPLIRRLGATIRAARISRGLTQAQLAGLCGLTRLRIIGIEQGNPSFKIDAYFRAATSMRQELALRPIERPEFEDLTWMFK
jgi:DNA-binding XRE family transcriptional regulator